MWQSTRLQRSYNKCNKCLVCEFLFLWVRFISFHATGICLSRYYDTVRTRSLLTTLPIPSNPSFSQRNRLSPRLPGGQRIRPAVGLRGPHSPYAQARGPPRNILLQIQPVRPRREYSKRLVAMPIAAPKKGPYQNEKLRPYFHSSRLLVGEPEAKGAITMKKTSEPRRRAL